MFVGPLSRLSAGYDSCQRTADGLSKIVHAAAALEKQIGRYRQMTGEQRLAIALELHDLSCDVAREGIRRANPGADTAEVERLLHRRLELARAR